MKFKSICLSSMLIYGLYAGTAYPEAVLTSKAYVDNKVPAYNSATESQSLLTDTTTTGTIAKRAIFTDGTTYVAGTHANQIPTMGAVMSAITANSIPDTFEWSNTSLIAAGRYSTDFDGTYGNYPVADATKLVDGTAFATGLSMKQNRINGHAANAADSLLTDTTTTGTIAKRAIFNDTAANYDSTTQSTQIPTMGAVMSAISSATPTLPTGTPGTAVLYDNNGDIGDERAISDAAVYTGTGKSRELSNGTNLATITAVETKQNAITPRTSGNLVAYNGDDENGQALFTARSVMDASDVDDVINNSNGSWQEMGTEIRRSYTNDIVSGGAMGTALEKLGQAVDVLNSEVDNKQNKATCTMTKPGDSTVCYAYTFANVRSADTP